MALTYLEINPGTSGGGGGFANPATANLDMASFDIINVNELCFDGTLPAAICFGDGTLFGDVSQFELSEVNTAGTAGQKLSNSGPVSGDFVIEGGWNEFNNIIIDTRDAHMTASGNQGWLLVIRNGGDDKDAFRLGEELGENTLAIQRRYTADATQTALRLAPGILRWDGAYSASATIEALNSTTNRYGQLVLDSFLASSSNAKVKAFDANSGSNRSAELQLLTRGLANATEARIDLSDASVPGDSSLRIYASPGSGVGSIGNRYLNFAIGGLFDNAFAIDDLGHWVANQVVIDSHVADSISAIGHTLNTENVLDTDGSKILSVQNAGIEHLNVRRGDSLWGDVDVALIEKSDSAGNVVEQFLSDGTYNAKLINVGNSYIYQTNDYTFGAGYRDASLFFATDAVAGGRWELIASKEGFGSGFVSVDVGSGDYRINLVARDSAGSDTFLQLSANDRSFSMGAATVTDARLSFFSLANGGAGTFWAITKTGVWVGRSSIAGTFSAWQLDSAAADGASAIGFILNTRNSLASVTAKLLSLQNNGVEKFSIGREGGINVRRSSTAVSANSAGEVIIGVTSTAAPRTITLDTDDVVAGRVLIIKDESGGAGTNNITIDTEGAELIDGAASIVITANYGVARLYSDGSNWFTF